MFKRFAKKIRSVKFSILAGVSLIAVGLAAGGYTFITTWQSQQSASAVSGSDILKSNKNDTKNKEDGTPRISGIPARIEVPAVSIDLNVIPGYYYKQNNSWTLTLNDAQWGAMTAQANNKEGLTFIYAHYRKGVFLTLPKVEPGEKAVVTTKNGHKFTYKFEASAIVPPSDGSILKYQGKPILVLQTCTGLWYQNRQLFKFNLVGMK